MSGSSNRGESNEVICWSQKISTPSPKGLASYMDCPVGAIQGPFLTVCSDLATQKFWVVCLNTILKSGGLNI